MKCSKCGADFNADYGQCMACAVLDTVGALQTGAAFKPVLPDNFAAKCGCETCRGEAEAAREDAGENDGPGDALRRQSAEIDALKYDQPLTSNRVDTIRILRRIADVLEASSLPFGFTVSVQAHTQTLADLDLLRAATGMCRDTEAKDIHFRHHDYSKNASIWGGIFVATPKAKE